MALKYPIWINQVTNLSDARYCAGMGVQVLNFQLSKKLPHCIEESQIYAIMGWLSGVELSLEVSNVIDLNQAINMKPTYIVVSDASFKKLIPTEIKSVLKYNDNNESEDLNTWSYVMMTSEEEGPIEIPDNTNLILDVKMTVFQAEELLMGSQKHFIALRGGVEERAGVKNFDELADFLEAIEIDS